MNYASSEKLGKQPLEAWNAMIKYSRKVAGTLKHAGKYALNDNERTIGNLAFIPHWLRCTFDIHVKK